MQKYVHQKIIFYSALLLLIPLFCYAEDFYKGAQIQPPIPENRAQESKLNFTMLKQNNWAQNNSADVIDSVVYSQNGTTYLEIYTYSSSVKILTILKQISQGGWKNYTRTTLSYDASDNLLIELYENWDNGSAMWEAEQKKTSEYDQSGNKLTYLYENWDSGSSLWTADRRYVSSFDIDNNRLTYLLEKWYSNSQSWIQEWTVTSTYDGNSNKLTQLWDYYASNKKDWLYTFTYDPTGNRLSYLRAFREPYTTEWINYYQYLYSYDPDMHLIIDQSEFWDMYNNVWIKSSRMVYTYDGTGNLIEDISESPDGDSTSWKGSYRNYYSFDINNNLTASLTEKWDIINNIWVDYSRASYEYDDNDNLTYFLNENWIGSYWKPKFKSISVQNNGNTLSYTCEEISAYYSPLTGIDAEDFSVLNSFALSQNYPNPFNPKTVISYQLPVISEVNLSIYNVLGQKIATLISEQQSAGQHNVTWDASGFTSGLYIYRLNTGKHIDIRKMMYLK